MAIWFSCMRRDQARRTDPTASTSPSWPAYRPRSWSAREVLDRLETQTASPARLDDLPLFAATAPAHHGVAEPSAVEDALKTLDLDGMSPREAMDALYRLKGMLDIG